MAQRTGLHTNLNSPQCIFFQYDTVCLLKFEENGEKLKVHFPYRNCATPSLWPPKSGV